MHPDVLPDLGGEDSDEEKGKKDLESGNKRVRGTGNAFDDLDSIVVSRVCVRGTDH